MPDGGPATPPVLSVRALSVSFTGSGRDVPAVRGIDFDVHVGEVLGIVGESGSGKSVTALAITGLLPPTARVAGSIRMGDTDITTADPETLRTLRGLDVGLIFQDPTTTLNPVLTIGRQVIEGQIGPLAGEQRDRSRHGGAPDNGRCRARRIVTEGPRGGNVGWRGDRVAGGPGRRWPPRAGIEPVSRRDPVRNQPGLRSGSRPDHVRITLRISHTPQSVTSTFPVHTASGGTAPDFACDTPNMKTG